MSNFYYRSQFNYSNSAKTVTLRMKMNIGASGAPSIASGTGQGIASVSRSSAGTYVISLSRSFGGLMGVNSMAVSSSGLPAAPTSYLSAVAVSNVSAPSLTLVTLSSAGLATDPANGESMLVELVLNDSSLGY